jgi:hypothetical protein
MSGFSNSGNSMGGGGGYGSSSSSGYGSGSIGYGGASTGYGSSSNSLSGAFDQHDGLDLLSQSPESPEFMGMQRCGGVMASFAPRFGHGPSMAPSEFQSTSLSPSLSFGQNQKVFGATSAFEQSNTNFANPEQFRLAAADKASPYIIAHTNLSFDQIPSVTGVPIRRQFFPPRRYLAPSYFKTSRVWEEIDDKISTYFREKNIAFCLPETIAVFSVKGIQDDHNLIFDIYCCPTGNDTFVVEFRRVRGDAFILSKIFVEIRSLLATGLQDDDDEDDDAEVGMSNGSGSATMTERYNIPPADKSRYAGEYFSFDALIK